MSSMRTHQTWPFGDFISRPFETAAVFVSTLSAKIFLNVPVTAVIELTVQSPADCMTCPLDCKITMTSLATACMNVVDDASTTAVDEATEFNWTVVEANEACSVAIVEYIAVVVADREFRELFKFEILPFIPVNAALTSARESLVICWSLMIDEVVDVANAVDEAKAMS